MKWGGLHNGSPLSPARASAAFWGGIQPKASTSPALAAFLAL